MKYLTLFLLFLFSGAHHIAAQRDTIHSQCTAVIAASGLNIREKPTKGAKILGKIPFGAKIQYLSRYAFATDTIRDYPNVYQSKNWEFTAKWAKIKYKGVTGYVLDAWLYEPGPALADTGKVALLYPGLSCVANRYNPSAWYWYGYFKDDEGAFSLKKVTLNYFSVENDAFGIKDFGISVGNDKGLILIVGSRQPMQEGKRSGVDFDKITRGVEPTAGEEYFRQYGISRLSEDEKDERFHTYVVTNRGKKQYLKPYKAAGSDWPFMLISFVGDINGDGVMDFIFTPYSESGRNVLYLSSANGYKALAFFYWQYCC
jgi:uncharacterized protein YgiM (DUF1202 family)